MLKEALAVSRSSIKDGSHVISWYAPWDPSWASWALTSLATWKNISFEYTYEMVNGHYQFVDISNIDSYLTCTNITCWD